MDFLDVPARLVNGRIAAWITRRVKIVDGAGQLLVDNALKLTAKRSIRLQTVCHRSSPSDVAREAAHPQNPGDADGSNRPQDGGKRRPRLISSSMVPSASQRSQTAART
jgi:hypothetical protein